MALSATLRPAPFKKPAVLTKLVEDYSKNAYTSKPAEGLL
jgi:hypothetical protein